ncbi:hypothetical protein ACH42_00640 [Endozoicomonas sp. (ex Bugula neritina AB1)]|nr:hypothetical protein ACH42_00640 [Endozoicomonas sp. (ex Bugula neritina AB1)]
MALIRNVLAIAAGMLWAVNSSAADVRITNKFVRAMPAISGNSAGYMTLLNQDNTTIRLESVDTDLAAKTEIHGHTMENGMMKMFKIAGGLELPPGQLVKLEPGGNHIMLMGVKTQLKEGDSVDMTLNFSDGDAIDVTVPVKSLQQSGRVQLKNGSARATVPGMSSSAVYFSIHNGGKQSIRLTGVESPLAKKSELHTTVMNNGMMRMQEVEVLEIPAGGDVELKPGGYHVMLMGLNEQIKPGEHVPVTLSFSNGETVTIHAMAMKDIKGQGMAH